MLQKLTYAAGLLLIVAALISFVVAGYFNLAGIDYILLEVICEPLGFLLLALGTIFLVSGSLQN